MTHFQVFRGFYVIIRESYGTARQTTADNEVWSVRIACWMSTATDTHSEYVTVIAFLRQQWLRERAPKLFCTYVACLAVT